MVHNFQPSIQEICTIWKRKYAMLTAKKLRLAISSENQEWMILIWNIDGSFLRSNCCCRWRRLASLITSHLLWKYGRSKWQYGRATTNWLALGRSWNCCRKRKNRIVRCWFWLLSGNRYQRMISSPTISMKTVKGSLQTAAESFRNYFCFLKRYQKPWL